MEMDFFVEMDEMLPILEEEIGIMLQEKNWILRIGS